MDRDRVMDVLNGIKASLDMVMSEIAEDDKHGNNTQEKW